MMTRCLVNDMIQRKKGIIVNVSSGAALQPIPLAAVYAASKVYKCFMLCRFMQTVFFLRKIETKPFLTHLNADIHQELLFSYPRWVQTLWRWGSIAFTVFCVHKNNQLFEDCIGRQCIRSRCWIVWKIGSFHSRKNYWNDRLLVTRHSS